MKVDRKRRINPDVDEVSLPLVFTKDDARHMVKESKGYSSSYLRKSLPFVIESVNKYIQYEYEFNNEISRPLAEWAVQCMIDMGEIHIVDCIEKKENSVVATSVTPKKRVCTTPYSVQGISGPRVARMLNELKVKAPRGGEWSAKQVYRFINKIKDNENSSI